MTKRILILNGTNDYNWATAGLDLSAVTEAELGNYNGYKAPDNALRNIARITKENNFDAIIIQNNLGIGLKKVEFVDESALGKVVVVWNSESSRADKLPYQLLGIKHFSSAAGLRECLDPLFTSIPI